MPIVAEAICMEAFNTTSPGTREALSVSEGLSVGKP